MGLDQQELCLNFKPTHYIPKTISEFLERVSTIPNESEKLLKLDNFIKKLEDEMRKIDAFKRELPLSVVLINDAIIALKEELIKCRKTSVELKLEEFIPLKKSCDDEAQKDEVTKDKESVDKKNWMSSVQLWNSTDNQNTEFIHNPKPKLPNPIVESIKAEDLYKSCKTETDGRAFVPCNGYPDFPVVTTKEDKKGLPGPGLSLLTPGTSKPREEFGADVLSSKTSSSKGGSSCSPNVQSNLQTGPKPSQQQQTSRKERRCWSPELHRRFVYALQQLGGSQAATPKQIRDLMQVDGLTNDEVKSHLQKYRLHTRRAPANTTTTTTFTTLNENPCDTDGLLVPIEESSKQSRSLSRSPPGPLQLTETTGGTSTTGGDSMEVEEDERSESYNWKHRIQTSGKDGV